MSCWFLQKPLLLSISLCDFVPSRLCVEVFLRCLEALTQRIASSLFSVFSVFPIPSDFRASRASLPQESPSRASKSKRNCSRLNSSGRVFGESFSLPRASRMASWG